MDDSGIPVKVNKRKRKSNEETINDHPIKKKLHSEFDLGDTPSLVFGTPTTHLQLDATTRCVDWGKRQLIFPGRKYNTEARDDLYKHFKLLKEMDPVGVADILYSKQILNEERLADVKTQDGRINKVVALLKHLDDMPQFGSNREFVFLLDALRNTDQGDIVDRVTTKQSNQEQHDLNTEELLNFFKENKAKIVEEIDPVCFIDDIVVCRGIDFNEYQDLMSTAYRRQRAEKIMEKISSFPHDEVWKILRPLSNFYKQYFIDSQQLNTDAGDPFDVNVGASISVTYKFTPSEGMRVITQDTQSHNDGFSKIRELERRIVDTNNLNPESYREDLEQIMSECDVKFKSIKFSSVVLQVTAASKESLRKMIRYCEEGKANTWLLPLLNDETKRKLLLLNASTVTVEVSIGQDEEYSFIDDLESGCICVLSAKNIEWVFEQITDNDTVLESDIMNYLRETQVLTESDMRCIELSNDLKDRTRKLTKFLTQSNIPQETFCYIERILLRHNKKEVFQDLRKKTSLQEHETGSADTVTSADISTNYTYLVNEVDARWFLASLRSQHGSRFNTVVDKIEKSGSRKERTESFIQFLCDEHDLSWFETDLKRIDGRILKRIMHPDGAQSNASCTNMIYALLSVYEITVNDLEPLALKSALRVEYLNKLRFEDIEAVADRRGRATLLMNQLLRNLEEISLTEVLNTLNDTGYSCIARSVNDVVENGALSKFYKCPRIRRKEREIKRCAFKTRFQLSESDRVSAKDSTSCLKSEYSVAMPLEASATTMQNADGVPSLSEQSFHNDKCDDFPGELKKRLARQEPEASKSIPKEISEYVNVDQKDLSCLSDESVELSKDISRADIQAIKMKVGGEKEA